jgi:hypothetical protein
VAFVPTIARRGAFACLLGTLVGSCGPAGVQVAIDPLEAEVAAGTAQPFSATVSGTDDPRVIWSIAEGASGGTVTGAGASGGSVSASCLYTAPLATGTYHVVAASQADPSATATAEVTVTPAGANLVDHGGTVLATPHVYAIWWGDPAVLSPSVQPFQDFVNALEGSSYLATVDQYLRGQTAQVTFTRNLSDLVIPAEISAADIGPEACSAITAAGLDVDPLGIYFVFTSIPHTFATAPAWHGTAVCTGATFWLAWVGPSPDFTVNPCATLPGPTSSTVADAGHELFETMTDPSPGRGWYDAQGAEIADKCQYGCHPVGSTTWLTTALWSNGTGACEP